MCIRDRCISHIEFGSALADGISTILSSIPLLVISFSSNPDFIGELLRSRSISKSGLTSSLFGKGAALSEAFKESIASFNIFSVVSITIFRDNEIKRMKWSTVFSLYNNQTDSEVKKHVKSIEKEYQINIKNKLNLSHQTYLNKNLPKTFRLFHLFFRSKRVTLTHASSVKNPFLISSTLNCLLYTSPSPRDRTRSRMPSSA